MTSIVQQNMESSSSKVQVMKPVLIGIPLAASLAGFIFSRILARKSCLPTVSSPPSDCQETDSCEMYTADQESFYGPDPEYNHAEAYYGRNALDRETSEFQEQILGLRGRIEDMQEREWQLEKRFLWYQELKDREMVLMELQNKLVLEVNRAEFLGREISLLEAENQRFENIAVDYLKVLRMLEFSRSENEKLCKRGRKLLGKTKQHSRILRKQRLQIGCKETEISRNLKEIEMKDDCIRLMEDEIRELKRVAEVLKGENNELLNRLRAAEESAVTKEEETVRIENYNQLASELKQLQKDEAAEVQELTYLRWCNACLRHELMRRNQEVQENEHMEADSFGGTVEIEEFGSDIELSRSTMGQDNSYLGFINQNRAHSKRRKLIEKFKKWVEGGEKSKESLDEKEKHGGNKCFRRRSASDGVEEIYDLPARKSCSSA